MLVFLDFEASSLSERSYPIEVAWVFEDGHAEAYLIRSAPEWTDWDPAAQAIHGIDRETIEREGIPHAEVAQRMLDQLTGHDLRASAPSWDGKWLSVLLRGAGLPRHSLRLRHTDEALKDVAHSTLHDAIPADELEETVCDLIGRGDWVKPDSKRHRALADARAEYARWVAVRAAADELLKTRNAQRPAG